MRLMLLMVAVIVCAVPGWTQAKDLMLRQRVVIKGPAASTRESTQYWSDNKLVNDDQSTRVILDLEAETVTTIDKERKTYFTRSFAEMRQQLDALKRRLESLPQAKELIGKLDADAPLTVRATGQSEKILGYDAEEYTLAGGAISGSIWAADSLAPPTKRGLEVLSKAMGGGWGPAGRLYEAVKALNRLPLRSTITANVGPRPATTSTEVIEVKEQPAPPEVLRVPEGFKQVTVAQ